MDVGWCSWLMGIKEVMMSTGVTTDESVNSTSETEKKDLV